MSNDAVAVLFIFFLVGCVAVAMGSIAGAIFFGLVFHAAITEPKK